MKKTQTGLNVGKVNKNFSKHDGFKEAYNSGFYGFNKWVGRINSNNANRNQSKPIVVDMEANRSQLKLIEDLHFFEALIDFDWFYNHFDQLNWLAVKASESQCYYIKKTTFPARSLVQNVKC